MFLFALTTQLALATETPAPQPASTAAPVPEVYRFVAAQRRLDLKLKTGALTVRTSTSVDAIEVQIAAPTTCVVDWDTGGIIAISSCAADVTVVAPFGTAYQLTVGTGDVVLDTSGKVRLSVGTGDVSGTARGGAVRVAVGTGNVQLTGLTEAPTIAVASGKTELSYAPGSGS